MSLRTVQDGKVIRGSGEVHQRVARAEGEGKVPLRQRKGVQIGFEEVAFGSALVVALWHAGRVRAYTLNPG